MNLIENIIETFENSRSNESWDEVWLQIEEFLKTNNILNSNPTDTEINGSHIHILIEY